MAPSSPALRPPIEAVLLETAFSFAKRSTCNRLHVGSVIARSGRIIATGYNGAPAGLPHCEHPEGDYKRIDTASCMAVVHAEANAICFAARHGLGVEGAQLYCTHAPCLRCATMILNSGIESVFYCHMFRVMDGVELLRLAGLTVTEVDRDGKVL